MKQHILVRFVPVVLIALACDGVTKAWVERALDLNHPVSLMGPFIRITLSYNTGIAFGLLAQSGLWLVVVTSFLISGMIAWVVYAVYRGMCPLALGWPLGLAVGGALGNFLDRLPDGRVTDFLDIGVGMARWPTFNLADSCLVVGMTLALLRWPAEAPPIQGPV